MKKLAALVLAGAMAVSAGTAVNAQPAPLPASLVAGGTLTTTVIIGGVLFVVTVASIINNDGSTTTTN